MREYVIKHNKFYLLEEVNGVTQVESIDQASWFPSIDNANKFCINDLHMYGIKREHIELIEVERTTSTRTLKFIDKQWQYEECNALNHMFGNTMAQFNKLGVK